MVMPVVAGALAHVAAHKATLEIPLSPPSLFSLRQHQRRTGRKEEKATYAEGNDGGWFRCAVPARNKGRPLLQTPRPFLRSVVFFFSTAKPSRREKEESS
jgi:hypothetical protein